MESTGKRAAAAIQGVDMCAVCSKCNRLSNNLKICDNCGNPLPEDSAAPVYASNPKRARIDNSSTLVNGTASSPSANGLPVNSMLAGTPNGSSDSIRPQTLYVNLNNQAYPVLGVRGNEAPPPAAPPLVNMPMPVQGMPMAGPQSQMPVQNPSMASLIPNMVGGHNQRPMMAMMTSAPASQPPGSIQTTRPVTNTQLTSALPQQPQVSLPSFNLQPTTYRGQPPPQAAPPAQPPTAPASQPQAQTTLANVAAYQIRIGVRKFRPLSTVAFKDDGILFTLKDYTNAPVLLNARAIIKCRANLKQGGYPIICLYLEGSCMRQIRNIFMLEEDEFSETSPVDLKRCISIYPQLDIEGRNHSSTIKGIMLSFERMTKRYPRSGNILDMVDCDAVIDIMMGASYDEIRSTPVVTLAPPTPTTPATARPAVQAPPAHQPQPAISARSVAQTNTSSSAGSKLTGIISTGPPTLLTNASAVKSAAMTLNMPTDKAQWQKMKEKLVQGGVYHLQMPNGQRKYCLWNGTELVPCVVQNMEIQLTPSDIYVGTYHSTHEGQVRVKADTACIYISIKPNTRIAQPKEIALSSLLVCQICLEYNLGIIILKPTVQAAKIIRRDLQLPNPTASSHSDPTLDPSSSDVRRCYVVILLKNINNDQREALQEMKHPVSGMGLFEEKSALEALKLVSKVKNNIQISAKIDTYLHNRPSNMAQIVEALRKVLLGSQDSGAGNKAIAARSADDDDDDVIMTSEEVGMKCPYTQQVMKDPVRNKICNHNYEKVAIQDFILRKKGNAKCPFAGCSNSVPLSMSDLEDNHNLREHIQKNAKNS